MQESVSIYEKYTAKLAGDLTVGLIRLGLWKGTSFKMQLIRRPQLFPYARVSITGFAF